MATSIAIVGISGYSGAELCEWLSRDEAFEVVEVFSDRLRDERLARVLPDLPRFGELSVRAQADASAANAEIVVLATPAEVSAELAPKLLGRGARVLDLSGAFRLDDREVFERYYGFSHPSWDLSAEAHYGLPQVPEASRPGLKARDARLVANPGCYATSAILSLAPLAATGWIDLSSVAIDGKSGVSGAGRKTQEAYLLMELGENVVPYKVAGHQHTPEIELALRRVSGKEVAVTFAPHLLPVKRGLMTTAFGRATPQAELSAVTEVVASYYSDRARLYDRPVVMTAAIEAATIARVVRSPRAQVGVRADARTGLIVAGAALDNLAKGAATQALENLRHMVGLEVLSGRG